MRFSLRLLALTALLAAGCGSSAAVECDDGRFCPAGTSCGVGGVCLVEPGSCAEFDENAACLLDGEIGYCVAGSCAPSVGVTGTIGQALEGGPRDVGLANALVTAVDREFVSGVTTNETGVFVLPVVANDSDLVIEARAAGFVRVRSRSLAIGDEAFAVNGNPEDPLSTLSVADLVDFIRAIGEEPSPSSSGAVVVRIRPPNADISAVLDDENGPRALYFAGRIPDADKTSTMGSPVVSFPVVAPGSYTLVFTKGVCRATGADMPTPVTATVVAGVLTNLGTFQCQP